MCARFFKLKSQADSGNMNVVMFWSVGVNLLFCFPVPRINQRNIRREKDKGKSANSGSEREFLWGDGKASLKKN